MVEPPAEERHLDDAQKALVLGTYLLAAALSWDSERGIYAEAEGDLLAVLPVEDRYLELAREAFMREGNKLMGDPDTELFIAWREDGAGHTLVEWHIQNPHDLALVKELDVPTIEEEDHGAQRS